MPRLIQKRARRRWTQFIRPHSCGRGPHSRRFLATRCAGFGRRVAGLRNVAPACGRNRVMSTNIRHVKPKVEVAMTTPDIIDLDEPTAPLVPGQSPGGGDGSSATQSAE